MIEVYFIFIFIFFINDQSAMHWVKVVLVLELQVHLFDCPLFLSSPFLTIVLEVFYYLFKLNRISLQSKIYVCNFRVQDNHHLYNGYLCSVGARCISQSFLQVWCICRYTMGWWLAFTAATSAWGGRIHLSSSETAKGKLLMSYFAAFFFFLCFRLYAFWSSPSSTQLNWAKT